MANGMSLKSDLRSVDSSDFKKPTIARDPSFTEVALENKNGKQPKRILHFSDGVLEEYSTDDDTELRNATTSEQNTSLAEAKNMNWSVYLWYLTLTLGTKTLAVCDYLGENLAHFFGITTPKYQYEIDEYQRMLQEDDELKHQEEEETAGWLPSKNNTVTVEQGIPALSLNLSNPPILHSQFTASHTSTPLQRF